jgi:hypothetical protein
LSGPISKRATACKVAVAVGFNFLEREDFEEGTIDEIILSAAMDYADIHGQEART